MNIAAGLGWIRETLPRQLMDRRRDERFWQLRAGRRLAPRFRSGFAGLIAIIGPAVCGLLARDTT
jgi:hypothetical protein